MDRRNFLRIVVDLPAELHLDGGERIVARVRDVSAAGVQIQCDALDSQILAPKGSCIGPQGRPIELDLGFRLDGRRLKIRCRVVFVRRVSHDEYRIGMRFSDVYQEDVLELEKLLVRRH